MSLNLNKVQRGMPIEADSGIPEANIEAIEAVDWAYGADRMWAVSEDSFYPCEKTEKKLPPGQYLINYNDAKGIFFTKKAINLDNLLVLPDSKAERVLKSIENFWGCEKKFRQHGFLWKRGIMLYGPAGGGKTICCQQLSQQIIYRGGISVYLTDPKFTAEGLRVLRLIEATRPIVVIIEDIDAIVQRTNESAMLALLDGELQIDNVVYVACLDPNQKILTKDLRWVPCGELRVGDEIWSLDENHPTGEHRRHRSRRYRKGVIVSSFKAKKECVSVELETGEKIICTVDHPWLATNAPSHTREWIMAKDLMKFPYVMRSFKVWETDASNEAGWFAGMLDGEGHVTWGRNMAKGFGVAQKVSKTLDKLIKVASVFSKNFKTTYHYREHPIWKTIGRLRFNGSMQEQAAILGSVRAERLIENFDIEGGVVSGELVKVVNVEYIGECEVQSIETTTHTYFGEGYAMHNTTNYPERLDARLRNRPSRFDEIIEISLPTAKAREMYILYKNPRLKKCPDELKIWVEGSQDLSIAHIREIVVAVECLGNDLHETIERIREMNVSKPSSEDDSSHRDFGFTSKKRD